MDVMRRQESGGWRGKAGSQAEIPSPVTVGRASPVRGRTGVRRRVRRRCAKPMKELDGQLCMPPRSGVPAAPDKNHGSGGSRAIPGEDSGWWRKRKDEARGEAKWPSLPGLAGVAFNSAAQKAEGKRKGTLSIIALLRDPLETCGPLGYRTSLAVACFGGVPALKAWIRSIDRVVL